MNPERDLSRWIERLAALKVESREVQRAGHRRAINGGGREEATIELAILVRTNAVDRQQLTAAIHHEDGRAAGPGETHRAVGKLCCREEALGWHGASLGGECCRLLCQCSVKLCCKHLAQALRFCIKRECSNNGLKEAHHNRAPRLRIGEPA